MVMIRRQGSSPVLSACVHSWEPIEAPIDSMRRWYRCSKCGAYGRSGGRFVVVSVGARRKQLRIEIFRCSRRGCTRPAVRRLQGRGPRCSYIWRCEVCDDC